MPPPRGAAACAGHTDWRRRGSGQPGLSCSRTTRPGRQLVTNKVDGHVCLNSMRSRGLARETQALPILLERHDLIVDIVR
jgi:hypothetical protein